MAGRNGADPRSRVWTIPNLLSMLRLLLVPLFLILLVAADFVGALVVLIIASLSDLLDGYLARRLNQTTRLGELLDPAADRLYILAALAGMVALGFVPWWILAVILGRDVFIAVLGVILANHGFGPLPVHQLGKVATFALFFGVPVIMLGLAFPVVADVSLPLGWAITLWGAFLYWWAGVIYAIETVRAIRNARMAPGAVSDTLGE